MNSNPQDKTLVKKYGLALHTSTPELGLAISNFSGDNRCQTWNLGRSLATDLHQYLVEFIAPQTWADLAFIAVAKGPGGFTGTRMGMVTARTLAQQLNIPVFTISTLAAVAYDISKKSMSTQDIALQMPAQRGQLFGAVYSVNGNSGLTGLFPDTVMTPESWQEKLASWGSSYQLIEVGSELGASVSGVLDLAYWEWKQGSRPDWWDALPYYGQHPVQGH
ncbi:MAG: tRNA (adenosine(37)-N6)-threonylcarbamoyltransferase complex dimerization subunit type 1 TsaB [Microcoleus sp. PH2017_29_MFU_D_A]|uniref:tRNA (adenosine(37)-N6)-threonylcarbamoyltransferase complex dimerization subunit type 1 TsaB n=1 Tax=unclassified Microcoleus TaxID=2642155 RepID=UPI001D3052AF|nr:MULTISPECIES: tRNA (adenosine(37)-N6)-threonylcarbamoyltransferase complex dimerization subunit type 1 TsaB [unclassified Microcoleus]MCC3512205.1 tRNA (adenosine(37)-N6)-threonylcarbamoyltransferase complex dimerization subunit type 1 TsaB [Microcoleus sp. PH2017_17_BER_D_A]TAE71932.1 MAG: tRNA (adenosine(37)-N6)-threonylcarbamoyltransferase complex dimerization subunit type 1 TsaB [Oscillatoriales cyanobacterium]MCC3423975.1 tRNA (adenosine(37)-N6)-threonylcarbamoyltransferase complex dimer